MTARGVRAVWIVVFSVLLLGGGFVACFGASLLSSHRSHEAIFSSHGIVHWWREGDWISLLVVAVIAFVIALVGADLARRQLGLHPDRHQLDDLVLTDRDEARGETVVHASALHHALEADLARQPTLGNAHVALYGTPARLALDGRVTAVETATVDRVVGEAEAVLVRWATTTGLAPREGTIVLKYTGRHRLPRVT